jgi:hypothetical protein
MARTKRGDGGRDRRLRDIKRLADEAVLEGWKTTHPLELLRLDDLLHDDGAGQSTPRPGRTRRKANADGRGRKLVDDDATTRRDILRDWKRAKEADLTAKEFCKRERERADGPSYLTEKYLRKLVSWAAKQKSRRR